MLPIKIVNCSLTVVSFNNVVEAHVVFVVVGIFVFKSFECDYTNVIKVILLCLIFEKYVFMIFCDFVEIVLSGI